MKASALKLLAAVMAWTLLLLVSPAATPAAEAAGSPDISMLKDMPDEVLYGAPIPVELSVSNAAGPDGFNLTVTDTLPAGVSYVPASSSPEPTALPQLDGSTVLVWENVADSLTGTTVELEYSIVATTGYDVTDTITNSAQAFTSADPRTLPDVDPETGEVIGGFTGNAAASDSTTLIPFELVKEEPSAESELLRGVHRHQTVYTLTVNNNLVNPSADFSLVDFLPAGIEFLGCGTVDNSTGGDEYPSSGPINPGNAPVLANPCITPSSVTTVTADPDGAGPLASGVYTRVEWDVATLTTSLAAGASFSIDYVAGIPLRANEDVPLTDPTANLDNNTGSLTTETEGVEENYAVASGTYNTDPTPSTDDDYEIVVREDISIHKSVDSPVFVQGDTPAFTLVVETSEYAQSTGPITVTDSLPATLNFTGSSPAADSAVLQADGTMLITWTLPAFASPSTTQTLTINTEVRESYRNGDGSDGAAVASSDEYINTTDLTADVTVISDNDGSTTDVTLDDESFAEQESFGPSILKEVSEPVAGTLTCGDGSGIVFNETVAGTYRPGDRVCWRLNVDFPSQLDTLKPVITDFLPDGFEYESWTSGAGSALTDSDYTFIDNDPQLQWVFSDQDAGAVHVEIVVSTLITDPSAAEPGDVLQNLMKFRYQNLAGEVFQARDAADAEYSEAILALDKGVIALNSTPLPGAPEDGTTVQEGDVVTYQLDVSNIGTEIALDTSIRDVLPPPITCTEVTAISNGGTCDAANDWIQWDPVSNLDISPGGSVQLTYDATVPVGTSAGASLINTAGVRTYGGENNSGLPVTYVPDNNIDDTLTSNTEPADDESEIVTALPALTKTVATELDEAGNTGADQATIGETVSYTIEATLPAGASYYSTTITDVVDGDKDLQETTVSVTRDGAALPAGFTVVADDATNTITVTFPAIYTIANGDDEVFELTFDAIVVDEPANVRGATSSNAADLDFDNAAGEERNVTDSVDITIVEPNITLEKAHNDGDGILTAGQALTYTLTATNDVAVGDVSVAHDVQVIDTVPAELIVLNTLGLPAGDGDTVSAIGGVWDATARTITWTIASIDPGANQVLTYDTQAQDPLVAAGTVPNTAEATTTSTPGTSDEERSNSSPQGDEIGDGYLDPADASLSASVLDLAKSVNPTSATIGEPFTFTLDVTIPAGLIAYDVTVLDDLPAGLVFEALDSVTCDESGGTCSPDLSLGDVTVIQGGGDVAFFFDDLTTTAATADRAVTMTYTAVVDDVTAADAVATLTNSATVHWNSADTITTVPAGPPTASGFDNSSTPATQDVETNEPALTIDKDVSGQNADDDNRRATPGETLTYTVTVTNTGTSDAFNVTVSDTPTDDTWAFTDTTVAAGVTNTDSDPTGGLAWTIDGPIAPSDSVTITYELVVPASYDSSNEVASGPEQENTADVPAYFGVDEATRTDNADRAYRDYDDVTADTVDIELDVASIGDTLWFDVDNDGVQDPGEPPLANVDVTVTYLGPDGVLGGDDDEIFTVSTNPDGEYLIGDLPGGDYTVVVDDTDPDFLTGLVPSYDLDGSAVAPNGQWIGTLGEDEDQLDVDFGYTGTGSIGDTIWIDLNLNGTIDPTEGRLPGVNVTVTWLGPDGVVGGGDDIVYTATTDPDGEYLVENLPPGEYTVEVDTSDLPAGYSNVSDPGGEGDSASSVTLGIGEANLEQDFGYAGTGSIGDTVWLDQDGDGTQNGTEPGLGGVMLEVTHYGPDGVPGGGDDSVYTATTDANGEYLIEDLPPGNYQVEVTGAVPANVTNSYDPDTAAPGDSISTFTLGDGEDNLDQDFGYTATSVLGDRVWWDLNGDGIQDVGEPGLNGIEVTATYLGPDGIAGTVDDEIFTTTTSSDGDYLFQNVPDGDYTVAVTGGLASGLSPTYDEDSGTVGPDETTDVTLADEHLLADFGYRGDGSIGDSLWYDTSSDGVQDLDEFPLEGVTVNLTWFGPDGVAGGDDDITLTTTTGASGNYLFENLPAGEFEVEVDQSTLPPGVAPTYDADDMLTSPDGIAAATLTAGKSNLDIDFGFVGSSSIGDAIWLDQDGDGLQGPDEVGIGAVTVIVTWLGPNGPETFTAITDANGEYLVEDLPAGDFTVTIDLATLPSGLAATFDADGSFDNTSSVTLAEGETNLEQDFGYQGSADIGDLIWLDLNGDGLVDADEPGIPNQTVELTWQSPTGPVTFTTTTDADGMYPFPGLPDGDYTVTVVGGITGTATNTGDPNSPAGSGDSTTDLLIAGGVDNLDQDFGYQGVNTIGDQVWVDYDGDGVVDSNEQGIGNVEITITWFGADGLPGGGDDITLPPTTTDADGVYVFENLPDGSFSVEVTGGLPAGVQDATYDADSGITDPDASSIVVDLGVGDPDPAANDSQDFGFTGDGSIGDAIWLDLNGDGIQDPQEPSVPDVTVSLTGAGPDGVLGTSDDVVYPPQVTGDDGDYLFQNLPPGDYQISYDTTDLDPGITANSDLDGGDPTVTNITLGPDEANLDVDFAVQGDASLKGVIFSDLDGDGVQGPGEEPIGGVTLVVTWDGPNGPVEFTVVTDPDGQWDLPNLPPGDYTVTVDESTVPPEHLATIPSATEITIEPGATGVVSNAYAPQASIGDFVWSDDDGDGQVDPGEAGLPGVIITLLDADGEVVATTTTDENGRYSFDQLIPGIYTVSIDTSSLPEDFSITSSPSGDEDSSTTFTLLGGDDNDAIDFGVTPPRAQDPQDPNNESQDSNQGPLDSDPPSTLALTGASTMYVLLSSLALILAGWSFLFFTRRRRKEQS